MAEISALHPQATTRRTWPEAGALTVRGLKLSLRNVDGLITALALPVMLMLIFVYLFGGAIETGGAYVDYVVPGVLLVCAGFGAASTAVTVSNDLSHGMVDRFRSMDVRGELLIASHVVASVVRNALSTVLVFAVALAIGFRPDASPAEWAAAVGILALFVLALSWVSAAIGILAKSPEAANGLTFFVSFLPYPSSAFVPVDTMPSWLRGVASHQPITVVVDAIRDLLLGDASAPGGTGANALAAVGWSIGIIVVSVPVAGVLFRRRAG